MTTQAIAPTLDSVTTFYELSLADIIEPSVENEEWPQSEERRRVSEEVYWAEYYEHPDFCYEWNNGYLEVRPMADYEKIATYHWFVKVLDSYLEVYPIARVMILEIGFRLTLPHKTTIRKPDLSLVLHNNPIALGDHDRTYQGIFDLCVESLSDSTKKEIERDTKVKKSEYEGIGVKEYYILDPSGVHQAFYRRNPWGVYVPIKVVDGVIRSTVLPGFQFRIAHLTHRPALMSLVTDPVYRDFVMLDYQAEKARAEQERARAEQERARANRAEQELQLLKQKLGLI